MSSSEKESRKGKIESCKVEMSNTQSLMLFVIYLIPNGIKSICVAENDNMEVKKK